MRTGNAANGRRVATTRSPARLLDTRTPRCVRRGQGCYSIYHFLQADGAHWYQNTFNLNRTIISLGCRHHNSMNESRWEDEPWVALIDYSVLCLDSSEAVAAAHT